MAGVRGGGERELVAAVAAGLVCDLTARDADDRRVPGSLVQELCIRAAAQHSRGVRLKGAVVEGPLDLAHATLTAPLDIEGCVFQDAIDLTSVRAPSLRLVDCSIAAPLLLSRAKVTDDLDLGGTQLGGVDDDGHSLVAEGSEIGGNLRLDRGFTAAGAVVVNRAAVGGDLHMEGAELRGVDAHGRSLVAIGLRVGGSVQLNEGFRARGAVYLARATIENFLDMADAHIDGVTAWGASLSCARARIGGSAYLRPGLVTAGAVRLTLATIGGKLHMRGAQLQGSDNDGAALAAASIRVAGDVSLPGLEATAAVILERAEIGGRLDMEGARITGRSVGGYSLEASGVHVTGHVRLNRGFEAAGPVQLRDATFDSGITMAGAHITGADDEGVALRCSAIRIAGGAYFSDGFEAAGALRMRNSTFEGGVFLLRSAITQADDRGHAVDLRNTRLAGDLYIGHGFEAAGAIELRSASVGGELRVTDTRLRGTDQDGNSLHGVGLHVSNDVNLGAGLEAIGTIRLGNAVIGGNLDLGGAKLQGSNEWGSSLVMNGVRVGGSAYLNTGLDVAGGVSLRNAVIDGRLDLRTAHLAERLNLSGAHCSEFIDDEASWPTAGHLVLRGFRFGVLAGDSDWRRQTEWVRRQGFVQWSPDPYEQLAGYYVSVGDEDGAHRIRMARCWDELTHLKTTKAAGSWAYRLWRRPFGWLTGFGYRRWPAAVLLVLAVLAAGLVFSVAEDDAAMVPSDPVADVGGRPPACGEAYPCFNSWVYGADVVLPIIDFGQDGSWRPVGSRWWVWSRWALIAAGWVLASVFVAAFTGLIQRE